MGALEAPRAGEVWVLRVAVEEGDGVGDAWVAEVVAAGEDADGGLVGDGVGGVLIGPFGRRWQVALGATEGGGDGCSGGEKGRRRWYRRWWRRRGGWVWRWRWGGQRRG